MGKDILHRTSMLQSIESYSHIDAVIRLKQNYLTPEKEVDSFQYEGCNGVAGDSHDVIKTTHFLPQTVRKPICHQRKFYPPFAIFLTHLGEG